jgi:uncharacterized protein (TIGR02391 family)
MLITNTQVDELLSTLSDLSGLDHELLERCGILIRSERYDEAVSRAFVVLEERLRDLLGVHGGSGVDLSQKAFTPEKGQLADRLSLPTSEVEGIRDLFVGAFRAYRNRAAHTVAGYSLDEARGIINLVNLLLLVLEQARQAPESAILLEVSRRIGSGATVRLKGFLESLQGIGIGRGEGKLAIPYRVTLEYRAPSWDEPRAHPTTVFYLAVPGGDPVLSFRTGPDGLVNVVGLDVDQLESDLLHAGCVRVAAKSTPIRLFLNQQNSQDTLDRLYEILQDLMKKHRV